VLKNLKQAILALDDLPWLLTGAGCSLQNTTDPVLSGEAPQCNSMAECRNTLRRMRIELAWSRRRAGDEGPKPGQTTLKNCNKN
jgi:hypothetical protein